MLPIADPTDKDSKITKRKIIWVLTIRSTAVRLMGVALIGMLRFRRLDLRRVLPQNTSDSRCIAHELGLVSRKDYQTVYPLCIAQLCTTEKQLIRVEWYCLSSHVQCAFICV